MKAARPLRNPSTPTNNGPYVSKLSYPERAHKCGPHIGNWLDWFGSCHLKYIRTIPTPLPQVQRSQKAAQAFLATLPSRGLKPSLLLKAERVLRLVPIRPPS